MMDIDKPVLKGSQEDAERVVKQETAEELAEARTRSSRPFRGPGKLPDFASMTTARTPPPQIPSPASSPFGSPARPLHPVAMPDQPTPEPESRHSAASPWIALAHASGAPTPSLDGPGRSSPQLGYPFERLNIGGSWSGANIIGEESSSTASSSKPSPMATPAGSSTGPDLFAKYRAMAGQASAKGGRSKPVEAPTPAPLASLRRASAGKIATVKSPSPLGATVPIQAGGLHPLLSSSLPSILSQASTLILDLRPPSSFRSSHIPESHSLPIPSTLLRRPAFNIAKLTQMLSPPSREAVSHWKESKDIVMLDAESSNIADDGVMSGLAAKFDREGYSGKMWYVKGGHEALKSSQVPLVADGQDTPGTPGESSGSGMMAGRLGSLAFQQGSTGSNLQTRNPTSPATPKRDPFFASPTKQNKRLPQGLALSPSAVSFGSSSGSGSPQVSGSLQPANPFFDNIRQNLELSHGGITERITLDLPPCIHTRASELPSWLSSLVDMSPAGGAERLAEEFYQVEIGEQKRLQAVMDWHTKDSHSSNQKMTTTVHAEATDDYFPFSITAGVERGAKNRYKNIWPYDFSRVRLDNPPDQECDYINASYVQPRGTARKYIATQGPLDATFSDFWTLIWEQGVRVIVMLTKRYEGGLLKCGNYWDEQRYGKLKVHLVSQTGDDKTEKHETRGFDFGPSSLPPKSARSESGEENIQRVFSLSHEGVAEPPRKIIQIQCTAWPDFDVPDSPDVLLTLLKDVDSACIDAYSGLGDASDRSNQSPVLVHCSAGVGRTGSYIIVDAILDSLKRDRKDLRLQRSTSSPESSPITRGTSDRASASPFPTSALSFANGNQSRGPSHTPPPASTPAPTSALARRPSLTTTNSGHSGESGKSVSFLAPPAAVAEELSYDSNTTAVSESSPEVHLSAAQQVKEDVKAIQAGLTTGEGMDIDPPIGRTRSRSSKSSKNRKRDGNDSDSSATRSRLMSRTSSSERSFSFGLQFGVPPVLIKSWDRKGTPSPIDQEEGISPVAQVLNGMRIQRMSLVQSLRQYIFVHRAIIYGYLQMIDSDRGTRSPTGISESTKSTSLPYTSATTESTAATSIATEDEGHIKRRASPTELMPERPGQPGQPILETPAMDIRGEGKHKLPFLAKRQSFKKMRPGTDTVENLSGSFGESAISLTSQLSEDGSKRSGGS